MKFILYALIALTFLAVFSVIFFALKKDTKQVKRSAISIIAFAILATVLFFIFQKTGIHEITLKPSIMEFNGATLTAKKAIVNKDDRSVSLVLDYKNTKSEGNDLESIDNKDIEVEVTQGANNLTDDLDSTDMFSMVKLGETEKVSLIISTGDFNQDIVWNFNQGTKSETVTVNLN